MTNSWTDVANTKMLMVLGSNFVENHPGVVQYANEALENKAKFVAVDPRRTRTVVWGEQKANAASTGNSAFARIRPGSNGALLCGLMRYAINNTNMAGPSGTAASINSTTVLTDSGFTAGALVGSYLRVTSEGYNPDWRKITANTTTTVTFEPAMNKTGSPVTYEICTKPLVDSVYAYNATDAPYNLENVDSTTTNVLDYARVGSKQTAPTSGTVASNKFSPKETWTAINGTNTVFTSLKSRMNQYDPGVVADICGISVSEFNAVAAMITDPANRPGTIMYAMGGTQFSSAGMNLHAYCMLQCLLGNIGRSGGGVNALRGIHNVQGSTDMGTLYSSVPGYSDVPDATNFANETYFKYMDALFGDNTGEGLQQRGFVNMMHYYFMQTSGMASSVPALTHPAGSAWNSSAQNWNFDLMPQGVGYHHRKMFYYMQSGATTGVTAPRVNFLMCLGQNPAVTEPNQTEIRKGLKDVETLVCVDMYASETATCDRGTGNYTILLPSCAHVEESGSVTNSARLLQWRYRAKAPRDQSKNDLEILLRLAWELDDHSAFEHIETSNFTTAWPGASAYEILYGRQYHPWAATTQPKNLGWTNTMSGTGATGAAHPNGMTRYVGDAVAEEVFKQMAAGRKGSANLRAYSAADIWAKSFGALWIYADGYQRITSGTGYLAGTGYVFGGQLDADVTAGASPKTLAIKSDHRALMGLAVGDKLIVGNLGSSGANGAENRSGGNWEEVTVASTGASSVTVGTLAKNHYTGEPVTTKGGWSADAQDGIMPKSRAFYDPAGNGIYPRFGFTWLYNRHIFYNSNPCGTQEYWSYGNKNQPGSETLYSTKADGTPATGRPPQNAVGDTTSNYNGRYTAKYVTYCETDCPNRPTTAPNGGGNGSCRAPGDTHDYFVAPDCVARLFVHHKSVSASHTPATGQSDVPEVRDSLTKVYRKYSAFADWDYHDAAATGGTYTQRPSRFPKHWEPHETPRADLLTTYGRTGDVPTGGLVGSSSQYPLVLTTWRICWHFQGGVMTRNVPWLAELDPEAMIEINSVNAYALGIADGDDVYVHTARKTNCGPFKARVGSGTQANQNTKLGVVGIPWHWGTAVVAPAPLVDGPCANEACIDALETNIKMPESKACLCTLTKTLA